MKQLQITIQAYVEDPDTPRLPDDTIDTTGITGHWRCRRKGEVENREAVVELPYGGRCCIGAYCYKTILALF